MENRKSNKHKKGRIRYYTFSTRLKYSERNEFLRFCKIMEITPSELIRELILKKFKEEKE